MSQENRTTQQKQADTRKMRAGKLAERGATIEAIAAELGVGQNTVRKYLKTITRERARARWSQDDVLARICDWAKLTGAPPRDWDWAPWRQTVAVVAETTAGGEEWPSTAAVNALFEYTYPDGDFGDYLSSLDTAVRAAGFHVEGVMARHYRQTAEVLACALGNAGFSPNDEDISRELFDAAWDILAVLEKWGVELDVPPSLDEEWLAKERVR